MRIIFSDSEESTRPVRSGDAFCYWLYVLYKLQEESPFTLFDDDLYDWIYAEYGIHYIQGKFLNCDNALIGVEMADSVETMMLLRFPVAYANKVQ